MTLLEQIQQNLINLPPEKQGKVLGFITFLQTRYEKEQASVIAWQREIRQDSLLPGRSA